MKITINTKDLKKVLLIKAEQIYLIKVGDNKLHITNGMYAQPFHKVEYDATFDSNGVDEKFNYGVDSSSFFGALNGLKDNDMIIMDKSDSNGKIVVHSGGKLKFRLSASLIDDVADVKPDAQSFSVIANDIFEAYKKTIYCVSIGDTRQALAGINLKFISNSDIEVVATDGKRLSVVTIKYTGTKLSKDVIVGSMFMDSCYKSWLADPNPEIMFDVTPTSITMINSNTVIKQQLIEADFPDYQSIISINFKDNGKIMFTFDASEMERTLNKINFGSDVIKNVFEVSTSEIQVTSNSALCEAEESLQVANVTGIENGFKFAFGCKIISQFIKANKDLKNITMISNGNSQPFLISTDNSKYVLMPMKI